MLRRVKAVVAIVLVSTVSTEVMAADCIECHRRLTPGIVGDWQSSKHSAAGIGCDECHGEGHQTADDVAEVRIPTPDTCGECHEEQVEQFKSGKHAHAWTAMKAMPTIHWQPMALIDGMKGCGGCHKIGLKSEEEIRTLTQEGGGFGLASCDACHTRHAFSVKEARQPQACQTCHMGFDHPQWEMYAASKHGVRALLKQNGTLPESVAAPTCQTCHMQKGDHAVMTGWGFLAVRLPMPDDPQWAADRATILQALGVLDPEGKPTARLALQRKVSSRIEVVPFDNFCHGNELGFLAGARHGCRKDSACGTWTGGLSGGVFGLLWAV